MTATIMEYNQMNFRIIAEQIFLAGVDSVLPDKLITSVMCLKDGVLKISDMSFSANLIENIFVIGAGKASALMGKEVEKILGDNITDGHIVVKYGYTCNLNFIKVTEAGHPSPDSSGFKATGEILKIAEAASCNDLVICLLSGGGSALLTDVTVGCSVEDMIKVNDLLVSCGACISEINAVRKHLSAVKGGELARVVFPATLISLILSDVPGNQLDVIASGPTVPDPTTFHQALEVLSKYRLTTLVPKGILVHLEEGDAGIRPETPKADDPVFEKTFNILVGTNRKALEAASRRAMEFNINAVIINDQLQGDVTSVAEYLVATALIYQRKESEIKPICLLFGGETTVKVNRPGTGGRNQHLALLTALLLKDKPGITVLSAGSDGSDGTTKAAGAVVDSDTFSSALSAGINSVKYVEEFDSFHFFKKSGGHIITGPTMTNVMDIILVIVE